MSVQVRYRREAASFLSSFVGAQGELLVDTTNNRVQVHDGATPGGFPAARLGEVLTNTRTTVTDANYTALTGDRLVAFTTLTAARTLTLPSAATYPTGTQLLVVDESGACSATNLLTIARAGTDTINGATSVTIVVAYGYLALESNGVSKWTVVDQTVPASGALAPNSVTNATLAQMTSLTVKANVSGTTANASDASLSSVIDASQGSTRGSVLYRGAGGWTALTPGSSGAVLTSNGTGADPSYQPVASTAPNVVAFNNLKIANGATANTQVVVTADGLILKGASGGLAVSAISLTCSTAATGANGLDTGTVAVSTGYHIFVISNGTTTTALLSASPTAPTMPSGYTYKARVGWTITDASGNLMRTVQNGRNAQYVVTASTNTAALPKASGGTQGSVATPTYVSVSLTGFVPATAVRAELVLYTNGGGAARAKLKLWGHGDDRQPAAVWQQLDGPVLHAMFDDARDRSLQLGLEQRQQCRVHFRLGRQPLTRAYSGLL